MNNKKNYIQLKEINLLNNKEFISSLQFEADYAASVRGGHLPFYIGSTKKTRLVNDINIFTSKENKALVFSAFTGKN